MAFSSLQRLLLLLLAAGCLPDGATTDSDATDGSSTGSASSGGEITTSTTELPTSGSDTTEADPEASWILTGPVRLADGFVPPQDAIGTLHVALASECGDWDTTLPGLHSVTPDVDLHADAATYFFQVPPGSYHLIAFLDEDGGDADAKPGPGDLLFDIEGNPCRAYKLDGGNGFVDLPVELGVDVPFT